MATCGHPKYKLIRDSSTLKLIRDVSTKKLMRSTVCGAIYNESKSCCPYTEGAGGAWPYMNKIQIKTKGIRACSDDEIISALDGLVLCIGLEDPCEFLCSFGDYYFIINASGNPLTISIRNVAAGSAGNDFYFSASVACAALPMEVSNSYEVGDCGPIGWPWGDVLGYGGSIVLNNT